MWRACVSTTPKSLKLLQWVFKTAISLSPFERWARSRRGTPSPQRQPGSRQGPRHSLTQGFQASWADFDACLCCPRVHAHVVVLLGIQIKEKVERVLPWEASSELSRPCGTAVSGGVCTLRVQGHGASSGTGLPTVPAGRFWQGGGDRWDDSVRQGSLPPGSADKAPAFAPSALPSALTCLVPCSEYRTYAKILPHQASMQPWCPTFRTGGRRPATRRRPQIILLLGPGGPKEPKHQALRGRGWPASSTRTVPAPAVVRHAGSARKERVRIYSRYHGNFPQ